MSNFKNQTELFDWIYENRDWKSEIDGSKLPRKGNPLWYWCFAHVLPKGAYPSMKLDPENIMLMTPEQHLNQEKFEAFQAKKQALKERYYLEHKIKKL